MKDDFLWTEKYRPAKIDDVVLPTHLKNTFKEFIQQENIPNLLFSGSAGVGKTTIAKAMLNELGADSIMINGSLEGRNIDTLRTTILQYASSVSLTGGRKYVILDEADYLNPSSVQPALRNFMEEYSKNCGFILTCNHKNRIIPALQSRCSTIDFNITGKEKGVIASGMLKRIKSILEENKIEYDKNVVGEVIMKHFPDFRRVLNELQQYSATGKIDSGILVNLKEESIKSLITNLKEKNFTKIRKWVAQNIDNDFESLVRIIYDIISKDMEDSSIPQLVMILNDYQYKQAFVTDTEINLTAMLTEIMVDCKFK